METYWNLLRGKIAFVFMSIIFCAQAAVAEDIVPVPPVDQPTAVCNDAVIKGCVGECGASFAQRHLITRKDVANSIGSHVATFCLVPVDNSLCPNTDAQFRLANNGRISSKGDLADGDKGVVTGYPGDVVSLSVMTVPNNEPILCIRLGETTFRLGYLQWKE